MKKEKFLQLIAAGLVLFLVSAACAFLSSPTPYPVVREEETNQHLVETIDALSTQVAQNTQVIEVTRLIPVSPAASQTLVPQDTSTTNPTPRSSPTPAATSAPIRATPLLTTPTAATSTALPTKATTTPPAPPVSPIPITPLGSPTSRATFTPLSPPNLPATLTPLAPLVSPVTLTPVEPLGTAAPRVETPPTNEFCNQAAFIADVNFPDGAVVSPGQTFTKTWRIQNTSLCPWSTDYGILFVDGIAMGVQGQRFTDPIAPGQMVDISLPQVAPSKAGTYQSVWVLTDGYNLFGTGPDGKAPLWLRINVQSTPASTPDPKVVLNLTDTFCSANWESGAGKLPCPGLQRSRAGFVQRLTNPNLETRKEDEPALWTNPEITKDGFISGTFPPLKVEVGYRFMADIGCLSGRPYCDVLFRLNYVLENNIVYNLGEWNEKSDQKITRVDIDLTPLAGQTIQLQLIVLTNGPYSQDGVFWLQPQVRRK